MVCAKTNVSTVILITCSLFAFIHYFSTIQSNLLQRKHTTNTLISKEYVNTKYIEDINKQVSHNKNLSTSTDKLAYNGDVYLNIFDSARYEAGQKNDTQAPNTCVKTGLKPSFTICVYDKEIDQFVSGSILSEGKWEENISLLIKDILQPHAKSDVILLDIGANLGIHGLYAAKLGYQVWAIEPQQRNLIRMFRSALKSGLVNKMTFAQNGIDEIRRTAYMDINKKNNGGSYVGKTNDNTPNTISLQTVLLSDVFDAIRKHASPLPSCVIMKIDIEQFECHAFLGSPQVLDQTQDLPVIAVIMEWTFLGENDKYGERCPEEKVVELAKLFLFYDFVPFSADKGMKKMDTSNYGVGWQENVAWLSKPILRYYI